MNKKEEAWIRQVLSLVPQAKEIPMWGALPSFPWQEFTHALRELLSLPHLLLSPGKMEWKREEDFLKEIGSAAQKVAITLSPIEGPIFLIFPPESVRKLSSWAIHPSSGDSGFSDFYLQQGFFRFLSLEALGALGKIDLFSNLSPRIVDIPFSSNEGYCVDFSLSHEKETVGGRVIFSSLFHRSFTARVSSNWELSTASSLYTHIFLPISISVGVLSLSQETWKGVKEGDFVLLDYCSYYPATQKGTFQLLFETTPLFQIKRKEEGIKILDYALYYEENRMDDKEFDPSSYPDEESEEETGKEENSPAEMISPSQIPLTLTIEVAKIQLSLDKLLELKPGNVLDLPIHPERGVRLVCGGKCVATGELIQMGDVVGVKIRNIGP